MPGERKFLHADDDRKGSARQNELTSAHRGGPGEFWPISGTDICFMANGYGGSNVDNFAANNMTTAGSGNRWVKSSLSFANSNCVEVADLPGGQVGVRHSKDIGGPVLRFTADEWRAFLGGARNGEFDTMGRASTS